ncbi:hypothetical protein FDECE_12691 [Fusarium decemcellulare]|nr:hypothetical protein FDECE_12691 [Fusarium decemcellulare]
MDGSSGLGHGALPTPVRAKDIMAQTRHGKPLKPTINREAVASAVSSDRGAPMASRMLLTSSPDYFAAEVG